MTTATIAEEVQIRMADRQVKSKKQKSREAAVDKLTREITGASKALDDFLRITRAAECKAVLLTTAYPGVQCCSGHTYEAYKCIYKRLIVLQSILESMEDTAKQLGTTSSYLN